MGGIHSRKEVLNSIDLDNFLRLQLGKEGAHSVHSRFHAKAAASESHDDRNPYLVDDASRAEFTSTISRLVLGEADSAWIGPEGVGFGERVAPIVSTQQLTAR